MELSDEDFETIKRAVESGITDREFWWSRTPEERLCAAELMRRRKYGYDENSMPRFEKVFEVIDLRQYRNDDSVRHDDANSD